MKTAISLPEDVFHRASRRAEELGLSRSEFFARAAKNYLDVLDERSVTAQIDAALAQQSGTDDSTTGAVAAGRARLSDSEEEW